MFQTRSIGIYRDRYERLVCLFLVASIFACETVRNHVLQNYENPEISQTSFSSSSSPSLSLYPLSSPIFLPLQLAVLRLRETPKDLRVRATGNPKETVRRRGLLFCPRGRFRAAFTLSLVQQKAASLSTFRVLAHFTVRALLALRTREEDGRIYEEERRGEEQSMAWQDRAGQKTREHPRG